MAQTSYFWDGTTLGDASLAPYDDSEINLYSVNSANILGYSPVEYVIPNYGNNLNLTTSRVLESGAAVVSGYLYINNGDYTLTFDANASGNPRIDAVALDIDTVNQVVTPIVVKGTPGAVPDYPAGGDLTLYYVWIQNGYGGGNLTATHIWDRRYFRHLGLTDVRYDLLKDYMHNAGYMAFSDTTGNNPPEYWSTVAPITSFAPSSILQRGQRRGQSIAVVTGAGNGGMETHVPVPSGGIVTVVGWIQHVTTTSVQVTVEPYDLATGSTGTAVVNILYDNADDGSFGTQFIIRANSVYDAIRIEVVGLNNASEFRVGQISVYHGFEYPFIFPEKEEIIFFELAYPIAGWTGYAAKSSGVSSVSLGTRILNGTKAVILRLAGRDSGSAGVGPYYLSVRSLFDSRLISTPTHLNFGRNHVEGLPADSIRDALAIVPLLLNSGSDNVRFEVVASGAGTYDVNLDVVGIIT